MQRLVTFRQGDRAEYLAQYILSSFAISVPVPRQEDVGSDFHCSLLRRDGDNLRPYLPFNIQIKRNGDAVLKKGVRFGGVTEGGHWRKHEIEQLCQTDTPFLIGLVDTENQWMDVFSTVSRYFVLVNWSGKGMPREVALMPYQPEGDDHLGNGELEDLKPRADAPGQLWTLPIGQPIVRVSIEDAENEARCEEIKATLEPYLRMDERNAVLIRLGLGYFEWPLIVRPGKGLNEIGIGMAYGPPGSPGFEMQMTTLCKVVGTLLASYHGQSMKDKIQPWLAVLDQLPVAKADPLIQGVIQKAVAFANE